MILRKFVLAIVSTFDPKGTKAADKAWDKAAKSAARTATAINKLDRSQDKAGDSARKSGRKFKGAARQVGAAGKKARRAAIDWSALGDSIKSFGPAVAGIGKAFVAAATGIGVVGAAVLVTGSKFESLRAQLGNLLGGEEQAEAAFSQIQDFAKRTPFQVDAITTAFIKLTNQGITPTERRLTAFGDIAAANGKELDEFTEAVLDAAVGENERLKSFGIKAQQAGDKVVFTFRGQRVEVEKNAEAITKALVGFGEMEGIQGAMAVQVGTTSGKLSNLKDSFFNFLDLVARMGVLDEFKLLLEDIGAVGGDGDGLAGTLADSLITVLHSLREVIQSITKEDVEGFFQAVDDVAGTLADAIIAAGEALRWFTDMVGSSDEALKLMALAALAIVAAFTGPAGIVIAAGLVGVAIGRMLGDWAFGMDEVDARMERADERIAALRGRIKASNDAIDATLSAGQKRQAKLDAKNADTLAKSRARIKKDIGGLGAGLAEGGGDLTDEQAATKGFQGPAGRAAREALLTDEGKRVLAAVDAASAKKVAGAVATARREALRGGASKAEADRAASGALTVSQATTGAAREKAFAAATKAFGETGSAKAAAKAGAGVITGKKKKGKKGKQFFDFEQQAEAEARSRGEAFAAEELERLVSAGTSFEAAQAQARVSGEARAKELEERFKEAGKIIEATNEDSILDIIGLRGPGSVLEGRPAPSVLTINIAPVINIDPEITIVIQGAGGATLEQATSMGAEAAVKRGLMPSLKEVEALFDMMSRLQADRLISAAGGGRQTPGPPG